MAFGTVNVNVPHASVFYATYNVTTFATLKAAYDAGMSCACKKDGRLYYLAALSDTAIFAPAVDQSQSVSMPKYAYFSVPAPIICRQGDDGATVWEQDRKGTVLLRDPVSVVNEMYAEIGKTSPIAGDGIEIEDGASGKKIHARYVNPSFIVNGYFGNPVNQRGQSVYTGTGYGFDNWKATNANVKVTFTSYKGITMQTTDDAVRPFLQQRIENFEELLGHTVTLSLMTREGALFYATEKLPDTLAADSGYCQVTNVAYLLLHNNELYVRIRTNPDADPPLTEIAVKAIKLELGSQQTLAHKDTDGKWVLNEIPNYSTELAKCQRYLVPLASDLVPSTIIGTGTIFFFVPLPVTMRTTPTISENNFKVRSGTGVDQTGFTFEIFAVRANGVVVKATKANHGLTSATLNAGSRTLLSAEF